MIELNDINKTFRVAKRSAGFGQAVKALFHKQYTSVQALRNVSFQINEGEMVGYIGPNGAGKSSTIKIMCGILTPDSGSCLIDGRVPWQERIAHVQQIGVVFGQRSQLWWDVPVIDSFELIRDIYRVKKAQYQRNLDELVTLLDLAEIIRTPARSLSLGQRMRCEIAASLLHSPKILFLDEPTIGLDAVSKIAVRDFIKRLNREHHTTVILTTHDMQDIESMAERILLIGKGRILLDGTLPELMKRNTPYKVITVEYSNGFFLPKDGILQQSQLNGQAVFQIDTRLLTVAEAIAHLSSQAELTDLSIAATSVDEMVVSLYEEFEI